MLLAVLLVAAVPVALFAGVVMMLLGHVAGGLVLFGASILAAAVAVVIAGLSGVRHLRKLVGHRATGLCNFAGANTTSTDGAVGAASPSTPSGAVPAPKIFPGAVPAELQKPSKPSVSGGNARVEHRAMANTLSDAA